jgi:dUTP pyrophosphatase
MVNAAHQFQYTLSDDRAVAPTKNNLSDTGYDLTIIDEWKHISENIIIYETGVAVRPPHGFYFEVVVRSSMTKTGWSLSNNVGIIDQDYRGTLKIALTRIDPEADDLELPLRCAQLIPRRFWHLEPILVDDLDMTTRGRDGGINRD